MGEVGGFRGKTEHAEQCDARRAAYAVRRRTAVLFGIVLGRSIIFQMVRPPSDRGRSAAQEHGNSERARVSPAICSSKRTALEPGFNTRLARRLAIKWESTLYCNRGNQ